MSSGYLTYRNPVRRAVVLNVRTTKARVFFDSGEFFLNRLVQHLCNDGHLELPGDEATSGSTTVEYTRVASCG